VSGTTISTDCSCGTCLTCTTSAPGRAVADPLVFRHAAIKARLLSRIASAEIEGTRPLDRLGTREDDDPAIALIDAVAGTLHVLAWNAARLFDDGSIKRTEDRDALVDLTGMLGYEPRPALAATTTLAFTLDTFTGSPKIAAIPKGTKVASVPGQDEKPQTFETDADLEARAEWNALLPVQQRTEPAVSTATASITITGTSTSARVGDLLVAYLQPQGATNAWLAARIARLTRELTLVPPRTVIELADATALPAPASMKGNAFKNQVIILGQRAAAFGSTAPDMNLLPSAVQTSHGQQDPTTKNWEWANLAMPAGGTITGGTVDLDAVYPDAMKGRFTRFTRGSAANQTQLGEITSATELGRKGFGLAAKVTRVVVNGIDLTAAGFKDKVRETAIYIETSRETLLVTDADVEMPGTPADRITVQGAVTLPIGRRIVLSGEQWTITPGSGPRIAEVAILKSSSAAGGGNTLLVFEGNLASEFRSTTLSLLANAVAASHGDTPATGAELVGSAAAASPSPRFALKRSRLAYVPADNLRGYAPAIEVRVGERLYTEVPTLFGLGSEDRSYTVRTGREGTASVQFAGRLPSGTHNVSALYRTGGGTAGNLGSGRLTTIMTPILGVGSVTNPVAADGASDAETIEDMRTAAPQSIRTLDRVVSLADFEAFARAYRGVGKALATELQVGMRSVVCLTIATTTLASPGTDLVTALKNALAEVTVPGRTIRIEGFDDLTAQVTIALASDPALPRASVEAAVRTMLAKRFGRAARRFGEALPRSAVLAALHDVEGVVAARLTVFAIPNGPPESEDRLLCPAPTFVNGQFVKAGLLSIHADAVQFGGMLP
jgi:uncharacterized phage protein gp47/JayE